MHVLRRKISPKNHRSVASAPGTNFQRLRRVDIGQHGRLFLVIRGMGEIFLWVGRIERN